MNIKSNKNKGKLTFLITYLIQVNSKFVLQPHKAHSENFGLFDFEVMRFDCSLKKKIPANIWLS